MRVPDTSGRQDVRAHVPVQLGAGAEAERPELVGDLAYAGERPEGREEGCPGKQPQKGQQNSYLIERLATVSTA